MPIKVDLPAPLRPSRPYTSPSSTVMLTWSTAVVEDENIFVSLSVVIAAITASLIGVVVMWSAAKGGAGRTGGTYRWNWSSQCRT